jgi:hypothetical protein
LNAKDKLLSIFKEYTLWLKVIKVIIPIHAPLSVLQQEIKVLEIK